MDVINETAAGLSTESFDKLARFITAEVGIQMPAHKVTLVQSRLLRRARELGFPSVDEYGAYFLASSSAEECEHVINAITTNKTEFFREPGHFDYLTRVVIPSFRRRKGVPFCVWSAGCSSGQEAYTLAMVLSEYAASARPFEFAVLATDVSTRVLEKARAAIYPEHEVAMVPQSLRARYLLRSRNRAERLSRVVPALRRAVSFHPLNFMDAHYGVRNQFEAIFFRNVMIYFDRGRQEAVVNKLCRNLVPGGYLFVGHSESLGGLDCPLESVSASVYRKRGGK